MCGILQKVIHFFLFNSKVYIKIKKKVKELKNFFKGNIRKAQNKQAYTKIVPLLISLKIKTTPLFRPPLWSKMALFNVMRSNY